MDWKYAGFEVHIARQFCQRFRLGSDRCVVGSKAIRTFHQVEKSVLGQPHGLWRNQSGEKLS